MNTKGLHTVLKGLVVVLMTGLLCMAPLSTLACVSQDTLKEQAEPSLQASSNEKLIIVASIFASYDFARVITGDNAEVSLLIKPGLESHSFEPSPSDIIRLNEADVFIYAGGESDAWIDKIISSLDNPDLCTIPLTELVDTLEEKELEGMDARSINHDRKEYAGSEDHEHESDEHVWISLRNSQIIVSELARIFSALDTEHALLYQKNAAAYNEELAVLDQHITQIVAGAKRKVLVFGDRFPFRYFAEDYDLECYAAFPGCSSAVDTNPETIASLVAKVRQESLPAVFHLELSDKRIAKTLAEETGARMLCLHSAHTISQEDMNKGLTYLDLMQRNADNLEVALN